MPDDTTTLPTGYALSAIDPVYRETPWVTLDRLRAAEPVHHDRQLGRYFVTGGPEVERLVKDRDLVVDPAKANEGTFTKTLYGANSRELSLLMLDDPDHARQRRLVLKAFNKRSVDALTPRIESIASDLADDIAAEDGAFDFVAVFGSPLPTTVMAELLGIDAADRKDFRRWSLGAMQALNPFRTREQTDLYEQGTTQLADYLACEVEQRRGGDGDDLISGLARAEEEGDTLTTRDIVLLIRLLLIAGNSTTTDMIGSGVVKLLQNPEQLAKLKADPSLTDNALHEVLRVEPPVAQCLRTAPEDMELNGETIAKGETIHLSLFGAHYDPALNADPQRFDIGRDNIRHFAFGGGAHYCLGAQLGLAQGRIALPLLFERFPRLAFSPDHTLAHKIAPAFNGYGEIWLVK
ncbi:cytochrome P450 [Novosphingopyxis sp.]|uniref:cytochrome P450 n=1 Tax=Novosphingopyxis sp. TaxID=2709690 RepID=UPI003B594DEC